MATYFNPERWTNKDLNTKFGHKPKTNLAQAVAEGGIYQSSSTSSSPPPSGQDQEDSPSVLPRLLLYPHGEDDSDNMIGGESSPKQEQRQSPETPPQTPPPQTATEASTGVTTPSPPPHSQQQQQTTPSLSQKDDIKNDGLQQVVENKDQQTFEWIISQQTSDNKTKTLATSSGTSSPSAEDNSNFEDVFSSSKTAKSPDFWPTSSMPIRNLSTDLFEGWNNQSSNSKIPEIQRPSDVWRFGSTSSVNDSTLGGFWAWNPSSSNSKTLTTSKNTRSDSTSSSGSSSDEPSGTWLNKPSGRSTMKTGTASTVDNRRLGSTGWSSTGPSSVHGSTESLTLTSSVSAFRAFDNEENFYLGESLLQNLTNFKTRNETLV